MNRPAATRQRVRRAAGVLLRSAFAATAACILLATLAAKTGPAGLYAALDLPFQWLCHRIPERVLHIAGAPMPVCSRCAGLWLGMSVSAAIARPLLSARALQITAAVGAALMLADVVTQDLGLRPVSHAARLAGALLLSVPFGGALGALITRELIQGNERGELPPGW